METGSNKSISRDARRYRITVRGEVSQTFVQPIGQVFVESTGDESILSCEAVDQAKLQAVLSWLYTHGVEILSVIPDNCGGNEPPDSRGP
jgi:hypothetical protein